MPLVINALYVIVFLVRRFECHADRTPFFYEIFTRGLPFDYWT
jgi:hypothetical protein